MLDITEITVIFVCMMITHTKVHIQRRSCAAVVQSACDFTGI